MEKKSHNVKLLKKLKKLINQSYMIKLLAKKKTVIENI